MKRARVDGELACRSLPGFFCNVEFVSESEIRRASYNMTFNPLVLGNDNENTLIATAELKEFHFPQGES